MGVFFEIRAPNRITASWDVPGIFMQHFLEQARFKLNGTERQIEVQVNNEMIDQRDLENANFTSMVDLVGNDVLLSTDVLPSRCPGNDLSTSAHCEEFRRVLREGVRLNEFTIRFPHRRDVVFNALTQGSLYREQRDGKNSPTFIRRMPKSISDLPITDRQSLGGR
jgi:hypothetical protein